MAENHNNCVTPCWKEARHNRTGDVFPNYWVSCQGDARGPSGRLVALVPIKRQGYRRINLRYANGKMTNYPLHMIVAATFHGPRTDMTLMVRHLNNVKVDCRAVN